MRRALCHTSSPSEEPRTILAKRADVLITADAPFVNQRLRQPPHLLRRYCQARPDLPHGWDVDG